jgi:hypothetical protein
VTDTNPKVLAGISNPAVIDVIGFDRPTGEVLLVMREERPWTGGDAQLHELQEKFNSYASFILDGEMASSYPELAGKPVRIELRADQMPSKAALELLHAIHDQLELQDIKVEVVVREKECGGQNCQCHGTAS